MPVIVFSKLGRL